jgi:hypothetical protein
MMGMKGAEGGFTPMLLAAWFGVAAVALSCAEPAAPLADDVYLLATIRNEPLPAPMDAMRLPDGRRQLLEVTEGVLTLSASGRFRQDLKARRVIDGTIVEELSGSLSGTYVRSQQEVWASFTDAQGVPWQFRWQVYDSGRVLRGPEFNSWVYEYHLRQVPE